MEGTWILLLCMWFALTDGRGLYCYECFKARNPDLCRATTQCTMEQNQQLCGTRMYTERGYVKYELGCVPAVMCPQSENDNFFGPIGRRRRDVNDVIKCCDTDYCNIGQFQEASTTTVPETTEACQSRDLEHCTIWAGALQTDICQNPEVANHLCRHFCGKCHMVTTESDIVSTTKGIDATTESIALTTLYHSKSQGSTSNQVSHIVKGKQCTDMDKNCAYLQREEDICARPEVALGIGCYATCNFCTQKCQDLDGPTQYCQKEAKDVLCYNEEAIRRSKCFSTCQRCDLYCAEYPDLCGQTNATTPSGERKCSDKDSLVYCDVINKTRVCMDEQLIVAFGCYATCSRCDLDSDSNVTRPITHRITSTSPTVSSSIAMVLPSSGTPSASLSSVTCKDKDALNYCKIINPEVVCLDEQHIIKNGCFNSCSRCDLDPDASTVFPENHLTTTSQIPESTTLHLTRSTSSVPEETTAPSTRSSEAPPRGELTTETSGFACFDKDGYLCSKVNELILCQSETFIRLFGCFKTCNRCDLLEITTPGEKQVTTDPQQNGKLTISKHMTSQYETPTELRPEVTSTAEETTTIATTTAEMTTEATTTAEMTTEVTTTAEMTTEVMTTAEMTTEVTTTAEMTTEVTTTAEMTTEVTTTAEMTTEATTTTEMTTEVTTTAEMTTTADPFAACKGPINKDTGEFYLLRNNGMIPDSPENKFTLIVSSLKVKWIVLFNPGLGLCENITLNYTTRTVDVPKEFITIRNEVENKGLYVVTSTKTDITALYKDPMLMEGFRVIPKENLSTEYIVPSYQPTSGGESFIGIVSTSLDTNVKIKLRLPENEEITFNNTQYHNGDVIQLHMDARNSLELSGRTDFSGTKIESTKPIAVQTGVDMAYIPAGSGLGGQLLEMVPSVGHLGNSFLVPPFFENKTFVLRLIAPEENTTINVRLQNSSTIQVSLPSGDHLDIENAVPIKVGSDKPVLAAYYQEGTGLPEKPFMTIVKPLEQLGDKKEFVVPDDGLRHHILITAKKDMYPFLQIDGKGLIFKNPHVFDTEKLNTTYVVASADIGPGHHTIGPAYPGIPVKPGVIIYADSDTNYAYGYPV